MYQRKPRRFRRRSNVRGGQRHHNGGQPQRLTSNSFSNGPPRNSFRSSYSAEKLHEKYNTLAKEALSSGDRILSENYFQHADHFTRIIEEQEKRRSIKNPENSEASKVKEETEKQSINS